MAARQRRYVKENSAAPRKYHRINVMLLRVDQARGYGSLDDAWIYAI